MSSNLRNLAKKHTKKAINIVEPFIVALMLAGSGVQKFAYPTFKTFFDFIQSLSVSAIWMRIRAGCFSG
jgi:hypothetical protein